VISDRLDELGNIGLNGRCIEVCREILAIARALLKERDKWRGSCERLKESHSHLMRQLKRTIDEHPEGLVPYIEGLTNTY
jgi:hypothetical protein